MPSYTDRWGLSVLGPGDSFANDGYKFTDADIRLLDRLLEYATERHHHGGTGGTDNTPTVAPLTTLLLAGGAMPSAGRYYYRFTVVDPDGNESAPSPVQSIDTPPPVTAPQAPALSYVTGTGDLLPGGYYYALSAYNGANSLETKAANPGFVTVAGTNSHNSVSLTLPAVPLGATGLNVYRKSPSGMHFLYLTSLDAPEAGDLWLDDGTLTGDCDRSLPSENHTSGTNAVIIDYPGATPAQPPGWGWRIYRSENPSDWGRSYLTELAPIGTTPFTEVAFLDVGIGTQVGGPPTQAQIINSPPKINLTDAAEVQGTLPSGMVVVPHIITFSRSGPVTPTLGSFTWICDFDRADIIRCRSYLGVDSAPSVTPVIVDVNVFAASAATPTWTSIYADGPTRPQVPVGQTIGTPTTPIIHHLVAGDALSVDIDQGDDTAENLTVNVLLYVQDGSTTTSYEWEA